MLLNSHYLYAVISFLDDAWKDVLTKFCIGAHLLGILCHTDVALVDKKWCSIWLKGLFLPLVFLFRSPYLSREYLCLIILYHTTNPCRDAFSLTTRPLYKHLVQVTMFQSCLRKFYFPVLSVLTFLQGIFRGFLPTIEITYEENFCSIRGPLTENPLTFLIAMQTVIEIACCKVR